MPACSAASSSAIARCELASIHSAVSTARRRSRSVAASGLGLAPGNRLDKARRKQRARPRRGRRRCCRLPPPAQARPAPPIPAAAAPRRPARSRCCRRCSRPAPEPGKTTGTRRRRRGRGCRHIRRRDGRPGSTPPPVHESGRGNGSQNCPCAHRRSNGPEMLRQTACRPVPRCSGTRSRKCGRVRSSVVRFMPEI